MANRPANAGTHSAGPQQGPAAAPPPVHHQDFPRSRSRSRPGSRQAQRAASAANPAAPGLAWVPYLIVLAGTVAGLLYALRGSGHAGRGAGVVGGALLVAAAARLVLPPRYAGLLSSRGKALDVAAFAVLGAAVLALAVSLP
jgi:Protein of unknown function (DUF3017)